MNKIFIFLTTGFEEIEAIGTIDILRRGGVNIQSVSLTGERTVTGKHNIAIVADCLFEEISFADAQMLILPGGTVTINEHEALKREVRTFADHEKTLAAICAAPMVLGRLGILRGKKATCYAGFEKHLAGAIITDAPVVVDRNITTARAAAYTFDFALELLSQLKGKAAAEDVANKMKSIVAD